MDKELFERALRYGKMAMGLLKKGHIPPTPPFYDLLYTYASGTNPELNARVNSVFARGETPDFEVARALHDEFLVPNDMSEKLDVVSAEIASRIDAVHGAIDKTRAHANVYSDLLDSAGNDLGRGLTGSDLSDLTRVLLDETRRMQTANAELDVKLGTARNDIATLQRELQDVRRESMLDPLTRIQNRKSFDTDMLNAVADAERDGEALSLLLIDIDHFKKFNDNYGHQSGDQVLRLVATTLRDGVKDSDTAARYGGEEFAIILPGTDRAKATEVAERLRKNVRSKVLLKRSTSENLGHITVSIGIATFRAGDTVAALIERADICLYAAKNSGRNRVVDEDSDLYKKSSGKRRVSAA